jgi:hypothetical protein
MKSVIGDDVLDELSQMAARSPKAGAIVEVGVYQGGSALRLYQVAREQNRQLYLYDTFEGIPYKDDIDPHYVGDFGDCSYHAIRCAFPEASVVKGIFPHSAGLPYEPTWPNRVAFAHLDCDQYRSVKESIQFLRPLMLPGGIMWFDDYGALPGATAAVEELCSKHALRQAKCGKTYLIMPEEVGGDL